MRVSFESNFEPHLFEVTTKTFKGKTKFIVKLVSAPYVFDFYRRKNSTATFNCYSCQQVGHKVYAKAEIVAEGDDENSPTYELCYLPSVEDHQCTPHAMVRLIRNFRDEVYQSVKCDKLLSIPLCYKNTRTKFTSDMEMECYLPKKDF